MSFSSEVKEELSKIANLNKKEQVKYETIGYLISSNSKIEKGNVQYTTENEYNINRFNKLLNNLNINYHITMQGKSYKITFPKKTLLEELEIKGKNISIKSNEIQNIDIQREEENEKAMVRGAFMGSGSFNDPNKTYHLEMLFSTNQNARVIKELLKNFQIKVKQLQRKYDTSLYVKDGEEISKLLALMGASSSVLKYEEIRVLRDTRNNINRLVNCETANLNKTIQAGLSQIEDIKLLKRAKQFENLPDTLKEIANVRIENPDASLVELGLLLQVPIGKSGVNHRLKKIHERAEEIRNR
ncbi:MAG: DNA-binding protein WhiA [Clostridia bacterium]